MNYFSGDVEVFENEFKTFCVFTKNLLTLRVSI